MPDPQPVLDPVPKRRPCAVKPQIGRVVVRRDEDARLELGVDRRSAELGLDPGEGQLAHLLQRGLGDGRGLGHAAGAAGAVGDDMVQGHEPGQPDERDRQGDEHLDDGEAALRRPRLAIRLVRLRRRHRSLRRSVGGRAAAIDHADAVVAARAIGVEAEQGLGELGTLALKLLETIGAPTVERTRRATGAHIV